MVAPIEQVAQKRKATSALDPRPTSRLAIANTRWEFAHSQIKDYITPPLETITDLPCKPASRRWQEFPEDMGKINIGLVERGTRLSLVLTHRGSCTSRSLSTSMLIMIPATPCWGRSLETATGSCCQIRFHYGSAVLGFSSEIAPQSE